MPAKYENIYRDQKHALGEPTKAFVQFFESYPKTNADVLDVGCGQGRDALFIARLGHRVVGVDLAPTGIEQLRADANAEGLQIHADVADITEYQPEGAYDIILIDRTLHMLDADAQIQVLKRMIQHVRDEGYVLIADEKKNLPGFREVFSQDAAQWTNVKEGKRFLFQQKQ